MMLLSVIAAVAFASPAPRPAQHDGAELRPPRHLLASDDRVRLAEANRLRTALEQRGEPFSGTAPFALLLVTDSVEFLFWHAHPPKEFVAQGYDSILHTEVFARPRQFPTQLLASVPVFGQVPTIIVGQPANTDKNSTEWVLSVLHEHFHQLQYSRPGYQSGVDSLGLARGDQTGGWMLNYPFPYDSLLIGRLAYTAAAALADALEAINATRADDLKRFLTAYDSLRAALAPADRRYLDFQLWQEGVARYVEYESAVLAAQAGALSATFVALPDYVPYTTIATRLVGQIGHELRGFDLTARRRVNFYAFGAALALLFDRTTPDWKARYFTPMFTLDDRVRAVRAPAGRRTNPEPGADLPIAREPSPGLTFP